MNQNEKSKMGVMEMGKSLRIEQRGEKYAFLRVVLR